MSVSLSPKNTFIGNVYPNKAELIGVINYGNRGPKGEDGLSIVEVLVNADGSLTFVYNDGTEFTTDPLIIRQTSEWDDVVNKPFSTIGENLKVVNGALTVDTTNVVEQDNTKPITSGGVQVVVGNINALLETI